MLLPVARWAERRDPARGDSELTVASGAPLPCPGVTARRRM